MRYQPVRGSNCIGNVWQAYKPVHGTGPLGEEPVNPGSMDWWITDRIPFDVAAGPDGNTGSMDWWVTDRIPLNIWVGV